MFSPDLLIKLSEIHKKKPIHWDRISDYLWNVWFILNNKDYILNSWQISNSDISIIELQYKKLVDFVLNKDVDEISSILDDNVPTESWTNANIESLIKAFSLI
jgi:hypothetical protein